MTQISTSGLTAYERAMCLIGRSNVERAEIVQQYLANHFGKRGYVQQLFRDRQRGEFRNFWVDIGNGDQTLILIAHHDAVPGSPGANDNAAAIGCLFALMDKASIPPSLRVRYLFSAEEERGSLGAHAYVETYPQMTRVLGVLSLELCGIGDQLVLWGVKSEPPFMNAARDALGAFVVGEISGFGSDHQAFWSHRQKRLVPAYGLTIVPSANAVQLSTMLMSRRSMMALDRSAYPAPFNTHHTPLDSADSLQPAALDKVVEGLTKVIEVCGNEAALLARYISL